MIPLRLFKAVRAGELSSDAFAILVTLARAGGRRARGGGDVAGPDGLAGWTKSHDQFRDHLVKLRARGWINYESKAGQRRPYLIKVTGGAILTYAPTYAPSYGPEGSGVRRLTYANPEVEDPANAGEKAISPTPDLRARVAEAAQTEEKRKNDDVADIEFEQAIEPLGYLAPSQRDKHSLRGGRARTVCGAAWLVHSAVIGQPGSSRG